MAGQVWQWVVVGALACNAFTGFGERAEARQIGKIIGNGKAKPSITLSEPGGGWTVNQMVTVAGRVSDGSINPITVSINGDRYLVRVMDGEFRRSFPVIAGKNHITVTGRNRGGVAQEQRAVFAEIPANALFLVLTSDTDGVYTDLHVYEPLGTRPKNKPQGKDEHFHIYWADTSSPSGGKFYLNADGGSYDQPGYGPYLYTHTAPPLGVYRIDANYWPSGDKAHTLATLNVVVFGGTEREQKRLVQAPLVMPGETVTLAWVKIGENRTAQIYVPLLDPKPPKEAGWPDWVHEHEVRKTNESSYY